MAIHPADEDTGIVFLRSDEKRGNRMIPARWNRVVDTRLCTAIGNEHGVTIGTIEHLMAALAGSGIDNAIIELNGPEVPVMDGSSAEFVNLIKDAGVVTQSASRTMIRIIDEVRVEDGDKSVTLSPGDVPFFRGEIDFPHPSIGKQEYELSMVNGNFVHDLANCRTFGFLQEVEYLRSVGLARGGSLDNAIVFDGDNILNPEGLRRYDEPVRHKLLDAIGDIYLAGAQILGTYHGVKPGHDLNNRALCKLFSNMNSFEIIREDEVCKAPLYSRGKCSASDKADAAIM